MTGTGDAHHLDRSSSSGSSTSSPCDRSGAAPAHTEMVAMLKKGDEIVTIGGMFGVIRRIGDDWVEIEVSKGTRVRFLKRADLLDRQRRRRGRGGVRGVASRGRDRGGGRRDRPGRRGAARGRGATSEPSPTRRSTTSLPMSPSRGGRRRRSREAGLSFSAPDAERVHDGGPAGCCRAPVVQGYMPAPRTAF